MTRPTTCRRPRGRASSRSNSAAASAWTAPFELQKPQPGLTIAAPIGGGGLASTAEDYGRFVRMLLNGGALDGARVLKAETVALMGQNHIGAVSVPALKPRCRAAPTSPSSTTARTNGGSAS